MGRYPRATQGKMVTVMFHTADGPRLITCQFNPLLFDSPAVQIITEHPELFARPEITIPEAASHPQPIVSPRVRRLSKPLFSSAI